MNRRVTVTTPVPGTSLPTAQRRRPARHDYHHVRQASQSPVVPDPAAAPTETQLGLHPRRDNPGCLSSSHPSNLSGITRVDLFDKDT